MLKDQSNLPEDRSPLLHPSALAGLEFDHIGLVVPDLAAGRAFLEAALGISRWTAPIRDAGLHVSVQFGSAPESQLVYELISPLGDPSPVANALRQGKSILNHVAYRTSNLAESADQLRELNCFAAGDAQPAVAYDGCLIQFWVTPLRFLIELIEKPHHRHAWKNTGDRHAPARDEEESGSSELPPDAAGRGEP